MKNMADFNPEQSQEPTRITKPTSVTVFGILNCVFGGLRIFCTPFIMPVSLASMRTTMKPTTGYGIWCFAAICISFGFSIWLLITGIGLLRFKRWARRGSVMYACVIFVWFLLTTGVNIAAFTLHWIELPEERLPGFIVLTFGGSCLRLIYPVLLLIFMRSAKVKEAFRAIGE